MTLLGGLSADEFLRAHWQKRPLLVRGAIPGFRGTLDADELAGLACEDGVESRIVRERGGARPWQVTYGPHDERVFRRLPDRGWTLLVQEVNRWVPDAALLLDRFAFVPSVRVDDVMVSFAAPGGSVGPHLDSYDVFLLQGQGERRWRWGSLRTKDARFRKGLELRILERPRFDRDEVLGPGDMLYLPPGFAHHGVGVTPCMTYSIGFRSPNVGEMWKDFAARSASRGELQPQRLLEDPPLAPAKNPGAIPPALLARARAAVRAIDTSDDAVDRWFAAFGTRLGPGHELVAPRRPPSAAAIASRLRRYDTRICVVRSEEGRWAFLPRPRRALLLYVGGVELEVAREAADLARLLCSRRRFTGADLAPRSAASRELLARLFAIGALHFRS
jgi:50S ribosomal protein L16 3-hydroxylase